MLSQVFFPQLFKRVPARRNVFAELERLHGEMDQFLGGIRSEFTGANPPLSAHSSDDEVVVKVELPGVVGKDVDVSVEDKILTIKGVRPGEKAGEDEKYYRRERWTGEFARSVELPFQVETEAVEAQFSNGVLTVKLPRAEANKPKKIAVQSA
ncbi:MAG: Hsp20 family protein [Candidatus Latescibacteria bacterium]|nr:Hsp20 family protein [Candidatus Latescibacterota bacterium]